MQCLFAGGPIDLKERPATVRTLRAERDLRVLAGAHVLGQHLELVALLHGPQVDLKCIAQHRLNGSRVAMQLRN